MPSSDQEQQQQEQLRMQILQQQQRLQLQQLQQQQYRQLLHQQQQHQQQTQMQHQQQAQVQHVQQQQQQASRRVQQEQEQPHTQRLPYTSNSLNAAARPPQSKPRARPVSTTISTLEDALAYPEQLPQLAPLHKSSAGSRAPSPHNNSSDNNNGKARKRAATTPAVTRKKFPRGLARFRDRLQHLEERLRLDVNGLKQELVDLQMHRGLMETRALTTRFCSTGSAAKIVHEYFTTFHNGIQSVPDANELLCAAAAGIGIDNRNVTFPVGLHGLSSSPQQQQEPTLLLLQQQVEAANKQNAFIEGLLDARMEFRKYVGRDVLREQWLRYSQCHAGLRMQLFSITTTSTADQSDDNDTEGNTSCSSYSYGGMDNADASTVVHTTGKLTAYITQQTLEQIFPNVLRYPGLAQSLLGAYIEYPFCIEFHVSADGKITKYDPDVDFVGALSKVVGNFEDVTLLMRGAVISEYCMIGAVDGYPVMTYDASPMLLGGHDEAQFEFEPKSADSLENQRTSRFVDKDAGDHYHHETEPQPSAKSGLDYILS